MENAWAVVMAGGKGTRFWPRSRGDLPKQCLALGGKRTLIQQTFDRISPIIPASRTLIMTGPEMAATIRQQLPELPEENVLVEPAGRNTAPCIAWATVEVSRRGGEVCVVLPSDHRIEDEEKFRGVLTGAIEAAKARSELVLLGQFPTYPETGFGYLGLGKSVADYNGHAFNRVERFIEKPSHEGAVSLLAEGGVLWNGGMFVWTVDTISSAFKTHLPATAHAMQALAAHGNIEEVWSQMDATSIDYGILERCKDGVIAVSCDFGWSDLGSWPAAAGIMPVVEGGVAEAGGTVSIRSAGNIVYAPGKLVALLDVEDLIIVDTDDVLLVTKKSSSAKIPELLNRLRKDGSLKYL